MMSVKFVHHVKNTMVAVRLLSLGLDVPKVYEVICENGIWNKK